jgi:hypothetical protein
MKARIAIGIGIIIVIISVVFGLTIFAGNEINKSTGSGQNSTLSPPPGRHLSVDLSEKVGIRQNP